MPHYSLKEIIRSLPEKKNSNDSFWVKYVVRKVSFLFTYLFVNAGCSAWGASVIGTLVAIAGSFCFVADNSVCRIIGVCLIELWMVLDCVDGNIARVKKTSSEMGEFIDALSGYYVTGFVYFFVGIAAYYTTNIFKHHAFILVVLGGVSAIAGLLARIIHQKYTVSIMAMNQANAMRHNETPEESVEKKNSIQYIRNRLDKEIGISGLFMPFLIVALIFNLFDLFTIFYCGFQCCGLIAVTAYYGLKAKSK